MHGRLKVKTTAQQEAEKKAERAQRVIAYNAAMKAVLDKREEGGEKKDETLLKMTTGLLVANPDITTLWNIRKETLVEMAKDLDADAMDGVFSKEVDLTQQCLMTNPKSYGAWHHRRWCLLRMAKPDWTREVSLCSRYLAMDERNFHVWDYRKFVTDNAKVAPAEELDYTLDKINVNFSNYSSWHYRSKLLPLVFPSDQGIGITEEKRREEIDLVQNAAFTDPEDSSAWFYHTWLLGHEAGKRSPKVLALKYIPKESSVLVVYSSPVSQTNICLCVNGENMGGLSWFSPISPSTSFSEVWSMKSELILTQNDKVTVDGVDLVAEQPVSGLSGGIWIAPDAGVAPGKTQDSSTKTVLEQDLANCRELLELEPDSKWTRLSMVLVMAVLDEERYGKDILESLSRLQEIDATRCKYYSDMRSKFVMASSLRHFPVGQVSLESKGISYFAYPERFALVSKLDLSKNCLRSTNFVAFLRNCEVLVLDDNQVEAVEGLELTCKLSEMSLKGNPIASREEDCGFLAQTFCNITFRFH